MTKSDAIRRLAADGHSDATIAATVGCSEKYVQVVVRQRTGGMSEADRRYYQNHRGERREYMRGYMREYQRERYATDPEFREARLKATRASYKRRKEREA